MKLQLFPILGLFFTSHLLATESTQKIQCTARIALNRILYVEVDRSSRELLVRSDNGTTWEGNASKQVSASTGTETYNVSFLNNPATQPMQMALRIQRDGESMLCLAPNDCYICR